jgi:hypothetical protein
MLNSKIAALKCSIFCPQIYSPNIKDWNIKEYNFSCFIWVWNSICHIKGQT